MPSIDTIPASPRGGIHPSLGVRYGTMRPMGNDPILSTRGQHLPQLIQNRSATNLRRSSKSFAAPNHASEWEDADAELGLHRARTSEERRRQERRRSVEAEVSGDGRGIPIEPNFHLDAPSPPPNFPLTQSIDATTIEDIWRERRASHVASLLHTPQLRSQRLIGNSNPRYRWGRYYRSEDELKKMRKPLRAYYERNNYLIQQYLYIDRLLDSSLPHTLIQEYNHPEVDVPPTIHEEGSPDDTSRSDSNTDAPEHKRNGEIHHAGPDNGRGKVKRTPKDIYRVPEGESTPLLDSPQGHDVDDPEDLRAPMLSPEEETDSSDPIVTWAININLAANTVLLIMKIVVTVLTSSVSVLASLVDAALDFLSTAIVTVTTRLVKAGDQDTMTFPVGRRRLEPVGILVFAVIMITSFFQVALQALNKLLGTDRTIVQLTPAAIAIMASTIVIKGLCWLYCRLIKNSSVQALAQDAETDVVFNFFSIIFPVVGYYTQQWWLDPLGGLLLSLYVMVNWGRTSRTHVLNLTGHAASKDERNILLYLTMRFAHTIRYIQGLAAYHTGDKINVEVDIVLNEEMSLRDSHDLGESLQYVLESVPGVERAFVHADYAESNLPTHMRQ